MKTNTKSSILYEQAKKTFSCKPSDRWQPRCVFFNNVCLKTSLVKIYIKRVADYCTSIKNESRSRWLLHHDTTLNHISSRIRNFLERHKIIHVHHPPYSPDMAPYIISRTLTQLKSNLRVWKYLDTL